MKSKAVPEGNGPILHNKSGLGGLTTEELRRVFAEKLDIFFDRRTTYFDHDRFEDTEEKSKTNQRLTGLRHEARQSRLATEANIEPDTETRKRRENVAADQVMNGDISSKGRSRPDEFNQVRHDS